MHPYNSEPPSIVIFWLVALTFQAFVLANLLTISRIPGNTFSKLFLQTKE